MSFYKGITEEYKTLGLICFLKAPIKNPSEVYTLAKLK